MKRDIKKDKRRRLICRIAFFLVAVVFPLIVVERRYAIIKEPNAYSIPLVFIVSVLLLLYRFRAEVIKWINAWEYSFLKHILLGINSVAVLLLLLVVLMAAQREMDNLINIIQWILIWSIVGYSIILPLEKRFDYYVKRELRKQEYREVRDE